ncbi:YceI family protein [Solibacillus sp. MA9]|uniref:YceI family protein n=1 Tax=Solibacillus palustris TaxID=2908203 RepID=A0ABS9U8T2_9BACL|nr:YceI family protein [Solibacillus sp. MA9]MCH7320734.1 YceI family protein [Solibacillus sp. MA9]
MAQWTVDLSHSSIDFQVKHMMVTKVKGTFDSFSANVVAESLEDLTDASISIDIDAAMINTKNVERDNHLKSGDFFDVENFPLIKFQSTHITKSDDDYNLTGDLTIKDVTKPVTFKVRYNGKGTNPWGVEVYGFEGKTKINREEFGLTWNASLETGGVLVGKDIKISVAMEVNSN